MSADEKTLSVYAERLAEYAKMNAEMGDAPGMADFIEALPEGAKVLDLGCGPGNLSAAMAAVGMDVDAMDASPEMVAHARATHGLHVCVARFDEIEGERLYNGVWANFSLLHAPKSDMPGHLATLHRALVPGGLLHIGMKLGEGEARDDIGRFYAYYSEEELTGLLVDAGFTPVATEHGSDKGLAGNVDPWIVVRAHA